jgi:hypothetical protein
MPVGNMSVNFRRSTLSARNAFTRPGNGVGGDRQGVGEIFGGGFAFAAGVAGITGGGAASGTGVLTLPGVALVVGSATLVAGGIANVKLEPKDSGKRSP